jgi:DNA-binding NtrC family response regulator
VLLARVGARQGRAVRFSPAAIRALLDYSWPGNVRELENALEYAVAVCKGQTLHAEDLPVEVTHRGTAAAAPATTFAAPTSVRREHDPEVEELRRLLDAHHWNRGSAARALGISRTTLWRRMREAGLARA